MSQGEQLNPQQAELRVVLVDSQGAANDQMTQALLAKAQAHAQATAAVSAADSALDALRKAIERSRASLKIGRDAFRVSGAPAYRRQSAERELDAIERQIKRDEDLEGRLNMNLVRCIDYKTAADKDPTKQFELSSGAENNTDILLGFTADVTAIENDAIDLTNEIDARGSALSNQALAVEQRLAFRARK